MSGLLRRIKRSRTAGAGEPPADQQAAAPEDASTTAETAPAGDEAKTTALPVTTPPTIAADPDRPAGLDERAPAAPPSGRRGRLRRRLRYLRRARELMLRDLGGLVYEVHRSGGGDFGAHRGVIDGKIERLVLLDAESGAIEQALGAPRSESLVFEPGIGGTCDECGELFGSAARFCSRCGTPTDPAARATPAPPAEPRHVPPMPKAPGIADEARAPEAGPAEQTASSKPADEAAPADRTAALKPADEAKPAEQTAALKPADEAASPRAAAAPAEDAKTVELKPEPAAAPEPAVPDEPAAAADEPRQQGEQPKDSGHNPFANISNGRPEEKGEPPELSSGDPLAARESRK